MSAARSATLTAANVNDHMVSIPGGWISLRDEGRGRGWQVQVKPFLLCRYAVTCELYASLVPDFHAPDVAPNTPATDVSWMDAIRFCNLLSAEAGLIPAYSLSASPDADDVTYDSDASGYRLPTEAEWEYGCRAGSNDPRYGDLNDIAWYVENSGGVVHEIGEKQPNAWGLYDTIGNVWEWCWDLYDPAVYGAYRVFRGGGFSDPPRACRASCRRKSHPTFRIDDLGFRLARGAPSS